MTELTTLPRRRLREAEVAALNRSEDVSYAVATETNGETPGLVIATENAVTGAALASALADGPDDPDADPEGWVVVEKVPLADADRPDALRTCEDAVVDRLS
ncbi:hypothetical protein JCM17823_00360 [Halorubrum gandharaense]